VARRKTSGLEGGSEGGPEMDRTDAKEGDGFVLMIASGSGKPVPVAAARWRRLVGDVEAGLARLVEMTAD